MPPPGFEPFVRAICANPDEDTLRLVYADWLEENGDSDRAAFIRLQIVWARTDHKLSEHADLRDRVVAMVRAHGDAWLAELPNAGISWDTGFPWGPFHRGLPASAAVMHGGRFAADTAERLFALAPIEHLVFPRSALEQIALALECPHVAPITGFSVIWTAPNAPWDDLCEFLANLTHLARLEALWLGAGLTDRGAAALSRAPVLPQLRELGIERGALSDRAVLEVAARLNPERVRRLSVPRTLGEPALDELRARFAAGTVVVQ
jgi:uncharacterized protein (TIGR02996 family)